MGQIWAQRPPQPGVTERLLDRDGCFIQPRLRRTDNITTDLGVKGLPWSIDFGSLKIVSDLRFRNGADSHEAAAKESTYA